MIVLTEIAPTMALVNVAFVNVASVPMSLVIVALPATSEPVFVVEELVVVA